MPSTGFELKDKIAFVHVHCSGHATASVNIAASFSFALTDNNGKVALDGNTAVNIDYKTLNVGYKMDNTICRIVSKLINFVIGGITSKIKEAVEKNLAPAIQKALTGALQKAFANLPVGITGSPNIANGVLSLPIDLDSLIRGNYRTGPASPPRLARFRKFLANIGAGSQDISVDLPQSSANTVLATMTSIGLLHFNHTDMHLTTTALKAFIPEAYTACPGCFLNIAVDCPAQPPVVSFQAGNFSLIAPNLTLKLTGVSGSVLTPLFTLATSTGFSVSNFTIIPTAVAQLIHFDLGVQSIQLSVLRSWIGKINQDVATIQFLVNLVVATIVPEFNAKFPGVPIPSVPGFSLSDITVTIGGGDFSAGFDVNL